MTWLLCDYGQVLSLPPSVADRDALESEAGTGGPSFWAVPGAPRLRRIAELDTIMWSRPNQASLDAAVGAAERGVKLALLSNAPARLAGQLDRLPWLAPFCPRTSSMTAWRTFSWHAGQACEPCCSPVPVSCHELAARHVSGWRVGRAATARQPSPC